MGVNLELYRRTRRLRQREEDAALAERHLDVQSEPDSER